MLRGLPGSLRPVAPCLALALAAACARERASAPSSAAIDSAAAPPPPTLSRFDVPIRYDFTPVLAVVERAVPRTFGSLEEQHPVDGDERKRYAYEAVRGPFTTFMEGSRVHLRTTLAYRARGYYKPPVGPTLSAGCGRGDERPQLVVELATPLTLTPSWHLRSAMEVARLEPASSDATDRCRVSILNYDVTDRVVDAARKGLVSHLPDIDRKVGEIDLTPRARRWWAQLNRPVRLAEGVWLLLQPRQLRAGRVTGEGHVLTVRAGLDAAPRVVTGPEPRPRVPPLPPLGREESASGFRVVIDGNVDYATASRALTAALRGRTVTRAGRSATVQSVTASPVAAGRLALAVAFTGDASGTLWFVGTPRYDARRGQIVVPDLDYDLETDSDLINTFAWLRSDELLAAFRERAQVPVAPVVERGRELLTRGLNRTIGDALTLSATVDSVTVQGLYVTIPGLVVRAGAYGRARVTVRQQARD